MNKEDNLRRLIDIVAQKYSKNKYEVTIDVFEKEANRRMKEFLKHRPIGDFYYNSLSHIIDKYKREVNAWQLRKVLVVDVKVEAVIRIDLNQKIYEKTGGNNGHR